MERLLFKNNIQRIKKVLDISKKSAYYYKTYQRLGINVDDINTYEDFAKLPILTKQLYDKHKFDILINTYKVDLDTYESFKQDFNKKKSYLWQNGLYVKVTSGSTGKPLEIIKAQTDIKNEYMGLNLYRKRILGKIPSGNFIWIWPVNKYTQQYFFDDEKPYYRVNSYGWQYKVSEYSHNTMNEVYLFILNNNISWITASPSFLYEFSKYIKNNNLYCNFSYIECHSEVLHDWQKEVIADSLGTHPISVYSSNEIQFMGIKCCNNKMHVINNNVFIEIISDEKGKNRVIATSLCNFASPLIRYELGDEAEWSTFPCNCKLQSPTICLTGFRDNDFLLCEDGRKFEHFVVTDSILFLKTQYNLSIDSYVVYQNDYETLSYYLDDNLFTNTLALSSIIEFLKNYYMNITNIQFKISLHPYSQLYTAIGTRKHKYFITGDFLERPKV